MKNNIQLFDLQDNKISQRFIEARKSTGLNMTMFANKAGINQSQVSEIEKGTRNITSDILLKLEAAFNISWRYLAKGEGTLYLSESGNVLNEPSHDYNTSIVSLKNEVELWKNRFLEVNDKYTALLESTSQAVNTSHNKRSTG